MAGTIKGITIEIAGNTQPLNKALEDVNKKTRDLQGELKSVERLLKLDPSNTELLAQKQKLLAEQVENSREKLDRLRAAQEQVNQAFQRGDLGEEQYRHFQRQVINAEQDLQKFENQLKQTGSTAKKTGLDIGGLGDKLKGIGATMSAAVTAPIVGGFVAITQGTKELRGDLARLSANAEVAGQDMGVLNDAMAKLNAVTGETDSNVEGLSNLLATGFRDEQLTELLNSLYGASIKFSDTLKFEGISDGLQETLATGAAIGPFAELLDRSGVALDTFNAGLQEAIKNGTEENYILEVLAKTGLAQTYEEWKKQNEEMVKAEEANFRMQQAMAQLGATLEPIMTPFIEKITELVNKFNEMDPAGQKIVLVIAGIAAAIGPILVVIGSLMTALPALGAAFTLLTGPVGIVIAAIAAIVAAFVALYKNNEDFRNSVNTTWAEIKASIKDAIDQIVTWWEEWGPKIMAVVEPIWNTIQTIVTTVMKVIGETISLVLNIVTGDWEGAGQNIETIAQTLWDGLTGIFQGIQDTLTAATILLTDLMLEKWGTFKTGIIEIWGAITGAIKGYVNNQLQFVNKLIDALNSIQVEIPDWVPEIGGNKFGINLPHVPYLAEGGIVTRPTLAMIGEAGPEAVIPLSKMGTTIGVIKIYGNNADEIWDKFERKLHAAGVRF